MAFGLRQLRHVLALAEHGSFSRAAAALGFSQPALSRSIQALEQQVGTPLFERTREGVVPTDVGRLYIQRARDVVRLADDLDHSSWLGRPLRTGRVTIGAGIYPAESILGRATAAFAGRFPGVSVDLRVGNWDDLLRLLRARELDFFVAEISTLLGEADLRVEPMSPHSLYFVARQAHPLAPRRRVTAAEILAWPLATASRIPPRILDPLLAAKRESPDPAAAGHPLPAITCSSLGTVKRIVERSDAVTAVTLSCLAEELEAGTWAVLATAPWLHVRYGIVSLNGHPATQAAEEFRDVVLETEAEVTREEQQLAERWLRPKAGRSRAR